MSNSGHLVIFKNILNINKEGLSIEDCFHLRTLLSILACHFKNNIKIYNTQNIVIIFNVPGYVVIEGSRIK